ncbi:cardiolipin synthase [Raineyella antarctica]|uniref:Cardiolipin synthase n=1 Tax=Raineyella antarctica TaxID=1577474 RepID=A0A1G6GFS2_9ACTN|nr:CDP-alcohol phosphatidyltransferase family protein [Raineyella antarctica]SDB80026.1 cardiolipin synthase [Raineyella antarctica]
MADRPDWATIPNAVTLLRFLLLGPVCWLVLQGPSGHPLPLVLLLVWASTDWIDGFLARRLDQRSRTGEVMDPIADRIGIALVALSLALAGVLSWWAVGIIAAVDLLSLLVAGPAAARGDIHVSRLGKVRTALMLVAIAALVAAVSFAPGLTTAALVLVWATVGLHVVTGATYVIEVAAASRKEVER